MMAPYTIAHLKLSSTLKETGAEIGSGRLGIYLTNSLEKTEIRQRDLFSFGLGKAITEESEEANKVKNDLPIMVILGNPPYNVSSQNKGEWIGELIKDYKKNLGERKINLDDDYIKFIRFSQYLIEKNGEGIIGMITNNSYIDGITHRQMRKFLLEAFDDIYILDLHGNVKKKETAPDGSKDENVFDIQQGVAISIFVRRTNKKKGLGKVFHASLYGRRAEKYAALRSLNVNNTKWQKVDYKDPSYFFVPKNFSGEDEYKKGFSLTELFIEYNSGIQTKRDDTTIAFDKQTIEQTTNNFATMTADELTEKYKLPSDGRDWQVAWAKADLLKGFEIGQIQYRPFDIRWTAYTGRSKGFLAYPREKTNKHVFNKYNPCILTSRNFSGKVFDRIFTTKYISDIHAASDQTYVFPLYQYEQDGAKFPNFNKTIYKKIVVNFKQKVEPENILDYVYAVLYSPNYREKYQEFLKIDFPHIPYPKNEERLFTLAKLGNELRQLHLLEHPKLSNFITTYPETGNDTVDKVEFKDGKIYINKIQYFGSLPKEAWDFSVGGYLPAQKYLKDRKSRQLSAEEIEHYQKIITALVETRKIMGAIAALDL
jgi:predicted helicase